MRNGSKAGLGFALCCGNIVRRSAVCPRGLTPLPGRTRPPGLRPGCPLGTCRPIRSGNAMLNHACRSTDSIRHIASSAYALRRDVKIPVISPESVLIFRHVCLLVLAGWINPKSETQASHDDWTSGLCGPLRGAVITLVGDHRGAGRLFRTLMRMLGARKDVLNALDDRDKAAHGRLCGNLSSEGSTVHPMLEMACEGALPTHVGSLLSSRASFR
mmetsp:Transcript_60186/g.160046  ORF Transcript_60186/g.160046 Transcript_60186/m.160046 type:complete len:215 (+) Transcript_60186:121-765(+)